MAVKDKVPFCQLEPTIMLMEEHYTKEFYKALEEGSRGSAREIIPLILEVTQPCSIVDVGCGSGTWLSAFKEFEIEECLGIDGDYVEKEVLQIS